MAGAATGGAMVGLSVTVMRGASAPKPSFSGCNQMICRGDGTWKVNKGAGDAAPSGFVRVPPRAGKGPPIRYNSEQSALIQMAKLDKKLGISRPDAQAYVELGQEARVPVRGPETHPGRPHGSKPHIHVGPVDHIPVEPQ